MDALPPPKRHALRVSRPHAGLVLLLGSLVMLLLPAPADAYVATGRPWPGGVVRYHSSLPASANWSIAMAARAWNTSGARVRFVPASRRTAQLRIRYGRVGSGSASATLGYRRGAFLHLRRGRARVGATRERVALAQLFAHEFGHVLGLEHTRARGCTLMAQYLSECLNTEPRPWFWNCRMIMPDDLRGAIRLYGRARGVRRPAAFCLRAPAAPAVVAFTASGGADSTPVELTWSTARNRALPIGSAFEVEVHQSTCAGAGASTQLATHRLARAARAWSDAAALERVPGAYCYRIRSVNAWALGTGWLQRDVTVTAAPPAPPTLQSLELHPDPDDPLADYRATVSLPSGTRLEVVHGAPGACPGSIDDPAGTPVRLDGSGSTWYLLGVPEGQGCLSFFAVRTASLVASAPTSATIDHPPHG